MTPCSALGSLAGPPAAKVTTAVDWPRLRARCRHRVNDLLGHTGIPDPWDINEFLDRLERHRRRDIDLCAITWSPGDSCGAWQQHSDHDVIAYTENTSGFHQDHIILHEVGHMISQHRGRCVLSQEQAQRIAPDLTPVALAHLLDRSGAQAEEHEAETIAVLIHQRARVHLQPAIDVLPPAADERLARVAQIFGF